MSLRQQSRPFAKCSIVPVALHVTIIAFLYAAASLAETAANREIDYKANLPVIFLDAKEEIVPDRKLPCTLQIVDLDESKPTSTNRFAGVTRIHGGVSKGYPKKSYGINLDKPTALLGLRSSANWLLNAAYIDRSLMRHKLSYDLFRSLDGPNARRFAVSSRFVEVHLNGKYDGAYLLMERLDAALLEFRPFNSNDLSHACIYKAIDHAANFTQAGHNGYEQRYPDPLVLPYWKPLDEFNRFVSSTSDADLFDPLKGIASRLDLDNAIDFHLLVLLTSNADGITKNFILARDNPLSGPKRFFFAPWDYDGTFGRNWDASRVAPSLWLSNHLFERLLGNASYREKFIARWKHLREHEFSRPTVQRMIDTNAKTLGPAAERNFARWPLTSGIYPDKLTFAEDIAQMKSWTEARVDWLDQEILQKLGQAGK